MSQPSDATAGPLPAPAEQSLGDAHLSTIDAIAQSLAVGPIFSAALFGSAVAGISGGIGPLVIVMTAVGLLGLAYVISLYARRYRGAGAVYEYISHVIDKRVGIFSCGAYYYGLMFLGGAGIYFVFGFLFSGFADEYLGFTPEWGVGAVAAALGVFALNVGGVTVSVRTQLTIIAVSLIPFIILAVAVLADGGDSGNTFSVFDPGSDAAGGIYRALLFAISLFIGIELAASLGEETANPNRSIPVAVVATVLIVGGFYLVMQYVGTVGFGLENAQAEWGPDPAGFSTLSDRYVGKWNSMLIDLAVLLDMLAVATGFTVTAARGLFALGRDGLLPAPLARTSGRGTPFVANIVILALALLMFLVFWASPTNADALGLPLPFAYFLICATAGALMVLVIYLILGLGSIKLVATTPGSPLRWVAVALAVVTPVLGIYGTVKPLPPNPLRWGVLLALIGMALAVVWTAVLATTRPRQVEQAAERRGVKIDVGEERVTAAPSAARFER